MKKTMVVTGGTGGIGQQTAIALARSGIQVVITGRDRARGEKALQAVREASGNTDVHLALGNLASLQDIHALACELNERFLQIDVLINNAGTLETRKQVTIDGIEVDFAVNVIAPYALTHSLLDTLKPGARVINLTGGMSFYGLDPANLQAEKGFLGLVTYSRAKRALEAMSLELAKELKPRSINVLMVNPGFASTNMSNGITVGSVPWWMRPAQLIFELIRREDGGKSAAKAARSSVWAATSPEVEGLSGQVFDTHCKPMKLHQTVLNEDRRAQVIAQIRSIVTRPYGTSTPNEATHS